MTEGWRGYLITNERFVLALDALPMMLSMGIYVFFNPGTQFGKQRVRVDEQELVGQDEVRKHALQRYLNL